MNQVFQDSPSFTRRPRRRFIWGPILFALLLIAFQYFSAESYTNPETGETVKVALTPEQEELLGLQSFREILAQSQVIDSGAQHDMVMRVIDRLIQVVDDRSKNFHWNAQLISSEQVNAFCLPGGKIAVYTGILPIAQSDDGLAAVLGHEIAHATARHGAQRVFKESLVQAGLIGVQGALSDMDYQQRRLLLGALGAGIQYGIILPYSRDHEYEADEIGLHYMVRAGFDPQAAVAFWQRMENSAQGAPLEFASTHPSHESRIKRLQQLIPKVVHAERQQQ